MRDLGERLIPLIAARRVANAALDRAFADLLAQLVGAPAPDEKGSTCSIPDELAEDLALTLQERRSTKYGQEDAVIHDLLTPGTQLTLATLASLLTIL